MNSQGKWAIISIGLLTAGFSMIPCVEAQQVNKKAMEKTRWFEAPREFQIIDDRPSVKDFREGPVTPQQVQLPNGPGGGAAYGPGSGALPSGGGDGSQVLPAGGLHIGNAGPGYRTPVDPLGALPKSGFGINSNIPARGIMPRGALPMGVTTGIHGSLLTPTPKNSPTGLGAGSRGVVTHKASQPAAASYTGNYRQSPPPTYINPGVNTKVTGTLVGHPLRYRLQKNN